MIRGKEMAEGYAYYIDALKNNPENQIHLVLPIKTEGIDVGSFVRDGDPTIITSFITQEFTIGGGNEWNSPLDSSQLKNLNQKLQLGKTAFNKISDVVDFGGTDVPNIPTTQIQRVDLTDYYWVGSVRPTFPVRLTFIATGGNDDVRVPVQLLSRAVYPSATAGGFLNAPLNYDSSNPLASTITLFVGTWMNIPKLVVTNIAFEYSKEVVKLDNGTVAPLYAVGVVNLTPYRQPTADEIASYMSGNSVPVQR